MNNLKYFIQFSGILFLFFIFKLLGLKKSSKLSGKIFEIFGPIIRSNKVSYSNLSLAYPKLNEHEKKLILKKMWNNYGKILAEYIFLKDFFHKATL